MKQRRAWALALLAYALGSVVFTLPMPLYLDSAIWGDRFDAWTTMWLIWHLQDALGAGELATSTQRIFFPEGYSLWSFGHAAIQFLGAPLMWLGVGLTATYNLLLLFSFTATGLAGHLLGHKLSGSHWGGLLAGALFAWNPYTYGEMSAGCLELVAAWFIPLYAWALVRVAERPTAKRAAVAGLVLAITGPFNWYYTAFLAMFTLAFLAWRLLAARQPGPHRGPALKAALLIALAAALAAVADLPLILKARQETPSRSSISAQTFSAENWALTNQIANAQVPLAELDEQMLLINDAMQVAINSTSLTRLAAADFPANPLDSSPGRLAYALGLFGLIAAGRRGRPWAWLALGFSVLTLGPFIQVDATPPIPEWSTTAPLPYHGLYNHLPFFSKAYRPYRIAVIVLLCLSALAATGYGRLRGRWRWLLPLAAALATATQPHWGGPSARALADTSIPPVYDELAAQPAGAVIELPLQYQPVTPANARYQYFQVAHGQDLLNCNQLIRRTDLVRFQDYVGDNRFLQTALDLGRQAPPYSFDGADIDGLYQQGFRYVVAHRGVPQEQLHLAGFHSDSDRLRQPAWDMLRDTLGEPTLVGDDGTLVYALPPSSPAGERTWTGAAWQDLSLPWVDLGLPLTLGDEALTVPLDAPAARLSLWILRPAEDPGAGRLSLISGERELELDTPAGQWLHLDLDLDPQADSLLLRASDGPVHLRLESLQVRP